MTNRDRLGSKPTASRLVVNPGDCSKDLTGATLHRHGRIEPNVACCRALPSGPTEVVFCRGQDGSNCGFAITLREPDVSRSCGFWHTRQHLECGEFTAALVRAPAGCVASNCTSRGLGGIGRAATHPACRVEAQRRRKPSAASCRVAAGRRREGRRNPFAPPNAPQSSQASAHPPATWTAPAERQRRRRFRPHPTPPSQPAPWCAQKRRGTSFPAAVQDAPYSPEPPTFAPAFGLRRVHRRFGPCALSSRVIDPLQKLFELDLP